MDCIFYGNSPFQEADTHVFPEDVVEDPAGQSSGQLDLMPDPQLNQSLRHLGHLPANRRQSGSSDMNVHSPPQGNVAENGQKI